MTRAGERDDGGGISPAEARAFYDRLGARLDAARLFEDRAIAALVAAGEFTAARRVLEFGCGTGRLAARLLERVLAPEAHYLGLDVSATMAALARARVASWPERAQIRQTEGEVTLPGAAGSYDRVLATFSLDLLPSPDIATWLTEAHRVLERPAGRLCVTNLTYGTGWIERGVSSLWGRIVSLSPRRFGGCRPIAVAARLPEERWRLEHHEVVSVLGVPFEVMVAAPR